MDVGGCLIVFQFLVFAFLKVADSSEVSIIGGEDVKKLLPWMVSIQNDQKHVCGGILIKHQWVLTAAHCKGLFNNKGSVTVLIGTLSLSQMHKGFERVGVIDFRHPEKFSFKTKEHDIMLLKLSKKVKAKPKTLPKKEQDVESGTRCVVTGWGRDDTEDLGASDKLQMLEVTVVDRDECKDQYKNDVEITGDMLCAGSTRKHRGTCFGDSGGPLECKRNIVGIVSGARGCGKPRKPTVYTFLSKKHLFWIHSVVKKQFNNTA